MSKKINPVKKVRGIPITQPFLDEMAKKKETDSTIMIWVEKTGLGYHPAFKIGVQTFHMEAQEKKANARWYCNMLFHAFTVLAKPEPGTKEVKFIIVKSLK